MADNAAESTNNKHRDVLESTQRVVQSALQKLGYPEEVYELLKEPVRLMTVRIPVRMDDGSTEDFHRVSGSA